MGELLHQLIYIPWNISIEAGLHQMKRHEKEFLNTYRPVLKGYGLKGIEHSSGQINKEDITNELIEKIATSLARDTKSTW